MSLTVIFLTVIFLKSSSPWKSQVISNPLDNRDNTNIYATGFCINENEKHRPIYRNIDIQVAVNCKV